CEGTMKMMPFDTPSTRLTKMTPAAGAILTHRASVNFETTKALGKDPIPCRLIGAEPSRLWRKTYHAPLLPITARRLFRKLVVLQESGLAANASPLRFLGRPPPCRATPACSQRHDDPSPWLAALIALGDLRLLPRSPNAEQRREDFEPAHHFRVAKAQ